MNSTEVQGNQKQPERRRQGRAHVFTVMWAEWLGQITDGTTGRNGRKRIVDTYSAYVPFVQLTKHAPTRRPACKHTGHANTNGNAYSCQGDDPDLERSWGSHRQNLSYLITIPFNTKGLRFLKIMHLNCFLFKSKLCFEECSTTLFISRWLSYQPTRAENLCLT